MKKIRLIFLTLSTSLLLWTVAPSPVNALYMSAAASEDACTTLGKLNPDSKDCSEANAGINKLLTVALNLLSIVAGVIAVIMVIISGFKYVTSQGDAQGISSSKQTLIYAIVGIVVVAFAQFIVKFVLERAGNAAG